MLLLRPCLAKAFFLRCWKGPKKQSLFFRTVAALRNRSHNDSSNLPERWACKIMRGTRGQPVLPFFNPTHPTPRVFKTEEAAVISVTVGWKWGSAFTQNCETFSFYRWQSKPSCMWETVWLLESTIGEQTIKSPFENLTRICTQRFGKTKKGVIGNWRFLGFFQ